MAVSKRHLRRRKTIAAHRSKNKNNYVRRKYEDVLTKPDPSRPGEKIIVDVERGWKYNLA